MAGFLVVSVFLIQLIFNLAFILLWLRIFLRYFRVGVKHPVGKVVYELTNPILDPIEYRVYRNRVLPRYDWVCFGLIVILEFIKFCLLGLIIYKAIFPLFYLSLLSLADLIIQPLDLLFYALIIRVILSWITLSPQYYLFSVLINLITDPLISLGRKIIPNISGFDFAPFIMMMILKIFVLFIKASVPFNLL